MSKHSISDAARIVGKHRSTIQKHIREGKLSKLFDHDGIPYIETSELLRVYRSLITPVENNSRENDEIRQEAIEGSTHRIIELEAILELEKSKREKTEALLTKAEESESSWKSIAERLTLLLTDQSKPQEKNKQYEKFLKRLTR